MSWRSGIVAIVLVAAVAVALVALPFAFRRDLVIDEYVVVDEDTLMLEAVAGDGEILTTDVVESETEVRVTIKVIPWFLGARADIGRPVRVSVDLTRPLGGRIVVDAFHRVPKGD